MSQMPPPDPNLPPTGGYGTTPQQPQSTPGRSIVPTILAVVVILALFGVLFLVLFGDDADDSDTPTPGVTIQAPATDAPAPTAAPTTAAPASPDSTP